MHVFQNILRSFDEIGECNLDIMMQPSERNLLSDFNESDNFSPRLSSSPTKIKKRKLSGNQEEQPLAKISRLSCDTMFDFKMLLKAAEQKCAPSSFQFKQVEEILSVLVSFIYVKILKIQKKIGIPNVLLSNLGYPIT